MSEQALTAHADRLAADYLRGVAERRPYPDAVALAALAVFDEPLPDQGCGDADTLALLNRVGSPQQSRRTVLAISAS